MGTSTLSRPWDRLEALAEAGDREAIEALLAELPPGEIGRALSRIEGEDQRQLFDVLEPAAAAQVVSEISDAQASELIEDLEPAVAAAILQKLRASDRADLLVSLDRPEAEAILAVFPAEEAVRARVLAEYPETAAGGLMETDVLAYRQEQTLGEVVEDLRRNAEVYADFAVQYVYAVDPTGALSGVLRLRDLLLRRPATRLDQVMIRQPVAVAAEAPLEDLESLFDRHGFLGMPVVDAGGRLLGLVRRSAVHEALADRADSDFRQALGIVGGEELRSMPVLRRSARRLSWLSVNILLNVLAASVIALHQDTLAAVIALAAFLPIISDMSGCSGNQAVAVSMRELALGLLTPADIARVVAKEALPGLLNGAVLGLLLGGLAWAWQGNLYLGLVVGGALAANTVLAVTLGGCVPLVLRRLGFDPALASSPILTTVTDLCGFLLTLTLASALMARLVG